MIWTAIKRGGGFALVLAIFGAAAIFAWLGQSQRSAGFAEGETAEARVIALDKSQRFQSGSTSTNYFVTYSVEGTTVREGVDGEFFDSLGEGETIPVAVLGGDPPMYSIDTGRLEESSLWALLMGVVLFAAAGALGWKGWSAAGREHRLRENGIVTQAEVVELGARAIPNVRFAWDDARGSRHEAVRPRHPGLGELKVGDRVEIVYDPDHPGLAMLALEIGRQAAA